MTALADPSTIGPVLVLNADYRPLSYYPLSLWSWQDAVRAVYSDRVTVVSSYDDVVRSPSCEIQVPSVIALKDFVVPARDPVFTRFNLFLRDRFTCQYCGERFASRELTFDHVIPRARGGRTNWENVVAACADCNFMKGPYMPHECHMQLLRRPERPNLYELQQNGRAFPPNYLHHSWRDFLYWDSELDT